jgi:hypothetical protein
MTRDKLIEFLLSNYEADQELLWTTAAQGDVNFYVDKHITNEEWAAYIDDVSNGGSVFDDLAQTIGRDFMAFRDQQEQNRDYDQEKIDAAHEAYNDMVRGK